MILHRWCSLKIITWWKGHGQKNEMINFSTFKIDSSDQIFMEPKEKKQAFGHIIDWNELTVENLCRSD